MAERLQVAEIHTALHALRRTFSEGSMSSFKSITNFDHRNDSVTSAENLRR